MARARRRQRSRLHGDCPFGHLLLLLLPMWLLMVLRTWRRGQMQQMQQGNRLSRGP